MNCVCFRGDVVILFKLNQHFMRFFYIKSVVCQLINRFQRVNLGFYN